MQKKYELTNEIIISEDGTKLHRIKALIDCCYAKSGDLGGYIESENNLSQVGNAWVFDNARVYGEARVYDEARVYGNAQIYGDARIRDRALVRDNAKVYGDVEIGDNAKIRSEFDYATIKGFGRHCRTSTFFRCKDGLTRVVCGCFYGTIDEFRTQVKNTRIGKIADEYLMIADLMEQHFK